MVEHNLAKVGVAGSIPVSRSIKTDNRNQSPEHKLLIDMLSLCSVFFVLNSDKGDVPKW